MHSLYDICLSFLILLLDYAINFHFEADIFFHKFSLIVAKGKVHLSHSKYAKH